MLKLVWVLDGKKNSPSQKDISGKTYVRHSEQRSKISDTLLWLQEEIVQARSCFLDTCNSWKQICDIQTTFVIHLLGCLQSMSIMTNNINNKHMKQASPVGRSNSQAVCLSSKHFSSHPKCHPNLQWDQLKTAFESLRRQEFKACSLSLDNDFKYPKTVLQL